MNQPELDKRENQRYRPWTSQLPRQETALEDEYGVGDKAPKWC